MAEEKRQVTQQELSARPLTKEDEFFRKQEAEVLELARRQREDKDGQRQCPTCPDVLVSEAFGDIEIDRCHTCQGIWLDPGELEILSAQMKARGENPVMKFFKAIAGRD